MAALTRSSRPAPNGAARASVAAGLAAVAAVPAAVAVAEVLGTIDLLQAAASIPVAAGAGGLALWLARRARIRFERTLGRVGGRGTATAGRALGIAGLCVAAAGAIALATYYGLSGYAE